MPHDKIRAAARGRMAQTGEPYTAARRAAVSEHQGAGDPPPGPGCALQMSGEIHDWLADLRRSDQQTALRVTRALLMLMSQGARLGDPTVIATTADSWSWALMEALNRAYQESLERLAAQRRGEADAAALVNDIQDQVAELESVRAKLEFARRRALAAGRTKDATQTARKLAALQQQAAEARRLLSRMTEARRRLRERNLQLQGRADAARARKEALRAGYAAAHGRLRAHEAMAALDLADDDGGRQPQASSKATAAAESRLTDITAQMERELRQEGRPAGLLELSPGAPWHEDIRILFAVEPPGTALLIAVLAGPGAVTEHYPEAVMAAADMLRLVRAGQAPEAAAHTYGDPRSFLAEFYPGAAGEGPDLDPAG